MSKLHKICFLGYGQLYSIAQKAIELLDYKDIDIRLVECNVETLPETVSTAISDGYEVFIAGAANAAEFARHSSAHLVEIRIGSTDYMLAIKKALQLGSRPVIAVYRFSRSIDVALLEELSGVKLGMILYEDSIELQDGIMNTDGDVIIGASHACETAAELNKKSVLLYPGVDSVQNAIQRAHTLSIELNKEIQRSRTTQAIINHAPFGLVVNDEYGRITIFNRTARKMTDMTEAKIQGRLLADVVPALSPDDFLESGQRQEDRRKLINGVMIRCVQTRIEYNQDLIGVLTTLYPDNTRRKKPGELASVNFTAQGNWKNVIGKSKAIQTLIHQAKAMAESDYPLLIEGEDGTGKNFFAQCIHNGSFRAHEPYITVNAAILPDQEAAKALFGSESGESVRLGLFELAQNGTIVLQNLAAASKVVQSCLLQAITERKFLRLGGTVPIAFRARVITIMSSDISDANLLEGLRLKLSVLRLSVPPLREREEDILPLFAFYLAQENGGPQRRAIGAFNEVLQFYSWPGNQVELSTVSKRYAFLLSQGAHQTANARQLLLIQAIGEDKLFAEIMKKHPALADIGHSSVPDVLAGIDAIKHILKYNNDKVAEKLSLSRTTLWRLKKSLENI